MDSKVSEELNLLKASRTRISHDKAHRSFWFSFLASCIFTFLFFNTHGHQLENKDMAALIISYSSISFSACLTALVLSLSMPGNDRIGRWSAHENKSTGTNMYLDLVIVLAFSTLIQALLLGYTLTFSLIFGPGKLNNSDLSPWGHIYILVLLFLLAYSFTRIYIILHTIWQLALVISAEEKKIVNSRK